MKNTCGCMKPEHIAELWTGNRKATAKELVPIKKYGEVSKLQYKIFAQLIFDDIEKIGMGGNNHLIIEPFSWLKLKNKWCGDNK